MPGVGALEEEAAQVPGPHLVQARDVRASQVTEVVSKIAGVAVEGMEARPPLDVQAEEESVRGPLELRPDRGTVR